MLVIYSGNQPYNYSKMKTKLLIISILLFISASVSAQYKEYVFGLKMGPSWNWMSSGNQSAVNNQTLASFNYGLFGERYLTEKFAISSGLTMNHLRSDYDFRAKRSILEGVMPEYDVNVSRNLKATYLCIPVLFKAKIVEIADFDCFVTGGLDLGFRLKAEAKDDYLIGVYHHHDQGYSDVKKEFKQLHASFDLGLGAEYQIWKSLKVFGQFVYNRAVTNLTSLDYSKNDGPVLLPDYFAFEFGVLF